MHDSKPGEKPDDDADADAALLRALDEIENMDPKLLGADHPTPVTDEEIAELLSALGFNDDEIDTT